MWRQFGIRQLVLYCTAFFTLLTVPTITAAIPLEQNNNQICFDINSYAAGYQPRSLSVGDLTGDGELDFVVPNWFGMTVRLLPGNGTGVFQHQQHFQAAM